MTEPTAYRVMQVQGTEGLHPVEVGEVRFGRDELGNGWRYFPHLVNGARRQRSRSRSRTRWPTAERAVQNRIPHFRLEALS